MQSGPKAGFGGVITLPSSSGSLSFSRMLYLVALSSRFCSYHPFFLNKWSAHRFSISLRTWRTSPPRRLKNPLDLENGRLKKTTTPTQGTFSVFGCCSGAFDPLRSCDAMTSYKPSISLRSCLWPTVITASERRVMHAGNLTQQEHYPCSSLVSLVSL